MERTKHAMCTIIPILRVADLRRSICFYRDMLGFDVEWGDGPDSTFASVIRDGCALYLCEGDQGNEGTWIWIGVADARGLCEDLRVRGAEILMEIENFVWALEFRIEDPDGHVLRIGSEPE